jgi:hypothetical protein
VCFKLQETHTVGFVAVQYWYCSGRFGAGDFIRLLSWLCMERQTFYHIEALLQSNEISAVTPWCVRPCIVLQTGARLQSPGLRNRAAAGAVQHQPACRLIAPGNHWQQQALLQGLKAVIVHCFHGLVTVCWHSLVPP